MSTRRELLACALLGLGAAVAHAGEAPPPAADLELLEFLGSLDTEEEEWREYLAERPIRPEAGKPAASAPRDPQRRESAPPAKEKTDDKVKQP